MLFYNKEIIVCVFEYKATIEIDDTTNNLLIMVFAILKRSYRRRRWFIGLADRKKQQTTNLNSTAVQMWNILFRINKYWNFTFGNYIEYLELQLHSIARTLICNLGQLRF